MREFLDDDVSAGSTSSGESDLDGIRGWAGATRLEEKLVAVLLLLFDLARARSLPDGLRGAKGARELRAAAVALGSEEAPQIIALLPMCVVLGLLSWRSSGLLEAGKKRRKGVFGRVRDMGACADSRGWR